jgi:hypothetical protein
MQERIRKEVGQGRFEEGRSCLPPITPVSLYFTPAVSLYLNPTDTYSIFIVYLYILFTSS